MSDSDKPDNVVYDEDKQRYDASLKRYSTNLGAPAIVIPDTTNWKNTSINKVNHNVKAKYEELKSEYEQLMQQYEYNNLIYGAKFSFEPVVGEIYHLYRDKEGELFLSIIAPHECKFEAIGSFRLNYDKMWEKQ